MGDVQDTLNDLIAACRDSEEGFGKAARGVHSENLRHRLIGIARQRADFAGELAAYLRKMGADSDVSAHRPNPEETIRAKADASLLAECVATEENTLRRYEQALSKDLPVPVRPIVDRHRIAVQEALLELRTLEPLRRAS